MCYYYEKHKLACNDECDEVTISREIFECDYTITSGDREKVHLFSSRTQKLSFSSSKILGWRRPGKIEHCSLIIKASAWGCFFVVINILTYSRGSVLHARRAFTCKHLSCAVGPKRTAEEDKNTWLAKSFRFLTPLLVNVKTDLMQSVFSFLTWHRSIHPCRQVRCSLSFIHIRVFFRLIIKTTHVELSLYLYLINLECWKWWLV